MTALTDPFANVHRKAIKNKSGQVVAEVDYVGWSQVADRLDEAAPGWSFTIRQIGDDWCWGQLTIDGRSFDNIGYAENADQDWKKEPLKDAVSDALKRCAAMAGVARYLYDKDSTNGGPPPPRRAQTAAAPVPPRPAAVANPYATDPYPEHLADIDAVPEADPLTCSIHGTAWTGQPGDLWHGPKGVVDGGYCRHPDNVKKPRR